MCGPSQPKEYRLKSKTPATVPDDDDEETFSRWLWLKYGHVSSFALFSPLFLRLASNTLDTPTFVTFALQERHFLTAFARAYEMVEPYADDDCKTALLGLRRFSLDRLVVHDHILQLLWGFNLPVEGALYEASPAATKYTDFLHATASGELIGNRGGARDENTKVALYLLAVVAPFMRLFTFIASEIKSVLDPNDEVNPYCKWVDNTSSKGFQKTASIREKMLDWLSFDMTLDEQENVERLYHHALNLLIEFIFDSALPIPQKDVAPVSWVHDFTNCQLTVICDFDIACAVYDSSAILADISINSVPRTKSQGSLDQFTSTDIKSHGSETQPVQLSSEDIKMSWDIISNQYMEELEQCVETIMTSEKAEGFHYEGLCSALEQIGAFEGKANERVVHSGLLKGLTLLDIQQAGHDLLDDGCRSFFQRILNNENMRTDVHIISYCWCRDIITSAFSLGGNPYDLTVDSNQLVYEPSVIDGDLNDSTNSDELANVESNITGGLSDSIIQSNELASEETMTTENLSDLTVDSNKLPYVELITTGEIIRNLETPSGKLQVFHGKLTEHCRNIEKDHDHLTIYIGGSVGDFLCLLQADIGIVIGQSSALRRIGDHFGVTFAPLFRALVKKQQQHAAINESSSPWKPMSGILYTVSHWAEIDAFILGGTSLT